MRWAALLAALHGGFAVAAGAFGAHGAADERAAELFRIGAQWEVVAALAALFAVVRRAPVAAWLFIGGGAAFAGSLYALALGGPSWAGAVAPAGGSALILGWIALAWREWSGRLRSRDET